MRGWIWCNLTCREQIAAGQRNCWAHLAREYRDFLKNAQLSAMNDPESLRQMRATHIKETA
jgi:hypothetical protein